MKSHQIDEGRAAPAVIVDSDNGSSVATVVSSAPGPSLWAWTASDTGRVDAFVDAAEAATSTALL